MKKVLCIILLLSQSLMGNAQTSGGQITRKSSSRSNVQSTRKNNSSASVSHQKVYPQCDEVFNRSDRLQAKGGLNVSYGDNHFFMLPAPDFNGHILERDRSRKQITLKQASCKPNAITDDDQWLKENGIQLHSETVGIGMNIGKLALRRRLKTGGYHVLLLGVSFGDITKVIVTDEKETALYAAYDFENFRKSPKRDKSDDYSGKQHIFDIVIEGSIMYVGHGGNTYSSTYGNQTGYITTIDLINNEILWTSMPLTNNSGIVLIDNSLITGYGFTDEPDYLLVLDKYSGQRVQKIPLKKAPGYIITKGSSVLVRTYSYDYVFSIK